MEYKNQYYYKIYLNTEYKALVNTYRSKFTVNMYGC